MRYLPRPKMGAGASDSDNDDDDSDGSLDILHHPGPGESLVSGLERESGGVLRVECSIREPGSILNLFNVKQCVDLEWL